jgi:hypothetical protein
MSSEDSTPVLDSAPIFDREAVLAKLVALDQEALDKLKNIKFVFPNVSF